MTAGYSGTPLWKKLGLKDGGTLAVVNAPASFIDDLGLDDSGATSQSPGDAGWTPKAVPKGSGNRPKRWPDNIRKGLKADEMLCIVFVGDRAGLEKQIATAAKKLHRDGSLWISWPKKSSKLFKDLTEDGIRDVVLPMGLVDVKVCAVNDDWSGLKLMVRKELRSGWNK